MKSRLFLKILVIHSLITIVLTIVIFVSFYQTIQFYHADAMGSIMSDLSVSMALVVSPYMEAGEAALREAIGGAHLGYSERIVVLDRTGGVRADTGRAPISLRNVSGGREFIDALNGIAETRVDEETVIGRKMLTATAPIRRGNEIVGVIMVTLPVDQGIGSMPTHVFVIIFLSVLFLSILMSAVFSASLSRPISELGHAAKRVAQGDFGVRVFIDRNDELKDLGDRFNYMTERIQLLFNQVSQRKDELLQIISSIDEALLVLDESGRIVLFNESLTKIAHDTPISGKYYWEVMRDLSVGELIEGVKRDRQNRHDEVHIANRIYACGVSSIESTDEIVAVFHDITDIKQLELAKKEFVTNVSHELRTPLTSIKGFIETLQTADERKRKDYIEIIRRNTDRMIDIIKDLLLLSEFEEKDVPLEIGSVDVGEMVQDISEMFDDKIKQKGLTITIDAGHKAPVISADPFWLEQMFINVIDNAIKYTEKGGITISLMARDDLFTAEIADTGIGIPRDDIGKIFNRFYRVDKSRARRLGGTGLGLSIVKQIVLFHGGDIEVESRVGVGSKFTIRIPQKSLT